MHWCWIQGSRRSGAHASHHEPPSRGRALSYTSRHHDHLMYRLPSIIRNSTVSIGYALGPDNKHANFDALGFGILPHHTTIRAEDCSPRSLMSPRTSLEMKVGRHCDWRHGHESKVETTFLRIGFHGGFPTLHEA